MSKNSESLDFAAEFETMKREMAALRAENESLKAQVAAAPASKVVGLIPAKFDPRYDLFAYRQVLPTGREFLITGNKAANGVEYLRVDFNVRWVADKSTGKKRPTRGIEGTRDQVAEALHWIATNTDACADWCQLQPPAVETAPAPAAN